MNSGALQSVAGPRLCSALQGSMQCIAGQYTLYSTIQCIAQGSMQCSGQCSRTRLTGLGHFHFLTKQQMHLATEENLDHVDDDVDNGDNDKCGKRVIEPLSYDFISL